MTLPDEVPGFLLLEDGTLFRGRLSAPMPITVAEVVFTTNMTGYQEVFTDPSYRSQIVVMTSPMIGNYGINAEDPESARPQVAGVVVRELSRSYSNWRAEGDLSSYLAQGQIPLLNSIDTRQLTRHLRSAGVMRGVIAPGSDPSDAVRDALSACPSMEGLDLASGVSTEQEYSWGHSDAPNHIIAYDYGIKRNILRLFEGNDCRVTVVPATTPAEAVLERKPDGIFLSNGPGDPAAVEYAPRAIAKIAKAEVPLFGICLGHQLIGLTFGGSTVKLPYGHRGGNHPVKELDSGHVLITSQNHGFAVRGDAREVPGAPDLEVTHVNLNDGTVEGLRHRSLPIFAVQYHPEAAPGPHDARPLFKQFLKAVRGDVSRSGSNA
ncbi:MAG: glutamine-hydrolyzing carbamoyl-phosphate synthase small subunit [Gemmatimonadaceae bacterium]